MAGHTDNKSPEAVIQALSKDISEAYIVLTRVGLRSCEGGRSVGNEQNSRVSKPNGCRKRKECSVRMKYAKFAKSAIAVHLNTGNILFQKHPFKKLPPASMTKMMTLLLAMEMLQQGKIKTSDLVKVSKHAASTEGSSLFLKPGEVMPLRNLLKGIVLVSGNDATVALAEHMAGTEANFVKLMNNKAKTLGLVNTHFVNVHGLDHKDHFSCAYDMFIIAKSLLRHQRILKLTSLKYATIPRNSQTRMMLKNTNTLLGKYRGVDGLKTGTTDKAKYCLTATAKKQGTRVVAVVMGEPTVRKRDKEMAGLLDLSLQRRFVDRQMTRRHSRGKSFFA